MFNTLLLCIRHTYPIVKTKYNFDLYFYYFIAIKYIFIVNIINENFQSIEFYIDPNYII